MEPARKGAVQRCIVTARFLFFFQMLDMITLGWPDLNPRAISMDFEKGAMNAFSAYFPEAEIHGCFFT